MNSSHGKVLVIVLTTVMLMSTVVVGQVTVAPAVVTNNSIATAGNSESPTPTPTSPKVDDPPTAMFYGSPYISKMGTTVTFDASSSSDDIDIVEYRWDFDGDGTIDKTTGPDESQTKHTYAEPGRQRATVTVVDTSNQTDTYANAVYVYDPDDETRPTATVHVPETVDVNETFTVKKTNLTDRTGVPYGNWYFDERKVGHGASATGAFAEAGVHSVTLVLVDAAGNRNMYTRQVFVGSKKVYDGHRSGRSDDSGDERKKQFNQTETATATDVASSPTDGATETPDLSESPGTPGFGISAAVLALLAALVAVVRD